MFIHGALAGDMQLSLPILSLVYRRAGVYGYSLINELRRPGALVAGRDFVLGAMARGELAPPLVDSDLPAWRRSARPMGGCGRARRRARSW